MGRNVADLGYYNRNGKMRKFEARGKPHSNTSITDLGKIITEMGKKFSQYCYI